MYVFMIVLYQCVGGAGAASAGEQPRQQLISGSEHTYRHGLRAAASIDRLIYQASSALY